MYIDPGSGSLILQIIIGFLLGALFFFKNFLRKVKNIMLRPFRNKRGNKENDRQ